MRDIWIRNLQPAYFQKLVKENSADSATLHDVFNTALDLCDTTERITTQASYLRPMATVRPTALITDTQNDKRRKFNTNNKNDFPQEKRQYVSVNEAKTGKPRAINSNSNSSFNNNNNKSNNDNNNSNKKRCDVCN